ncbi:hemicentin-1-like [Mytilus californianus]|uniref:hemicentin-1-like n=1 Tax=Mytilus californianus TaxID=6549 RepID=UPI002247C814|nr:hemicentin-1-like [Mytilus californianus]
MLDDIKCTGSESRLRNCPSSSWKVHDCTHTEDVGVLCNNLSPVNGGWSNWAQWTTCSSSCGVGLQTRTRQCNNPSTQYGGIYCYGLSSQTRKCNTNFCPVDGGWSTWAMWNSCNVTCGEGIQLRFRSCNHPTPAFGGLKCRSKDSETKQCFNAECPKVIDGGWSTWTNWTACTRLCNGGLMERARNCDSPPPINGGLYCNGTSTEANLCNTVSCSGIETKMVLALIIGGVAVVCILITVALMLICKRVVTSTRIPKKEIADTPLKEETEELYIYQESDRSTKTNTGFKEETEELYIYQESDQPTQAFHNSAYIKDYDSKNVAKPGVEFDSCDIYDNCEESCYENY